ncbi:uncharacterized protein CANTADRAFT_315594 [Suhomyces tanzawaensis NRRL Y-17324]|uniref:Zn(2)-C6 fungal-type domain-containing protein n=1 Tax=Suhomyces tanzawaensis NRRL Y-17324 TaxID=984487 RepID=A0A1E4SDI5_9ASCO|nr:uncharacterized protein CANTADRAFT_315594 [Suhomyces tanzawaensis NRRL Y-17324]ODV77543.1 hypothetical protein CANTADRAFT_315594 [Suhomyces tanzawaensis NRRL Y-17324]
MDKKRSKTSRSRTGCLTCRKRKKKCDELLYPKCRSCEIKNVECIWPTSKHELHRKLEQVKYVADSKKPIRQDWKSPNHKKHGYFLERIAMQQDCVEDQIEKLTNPTHLTKTVFERQDIQEATELKTLHTLNPSFDAKYISSPHSTTSVKPPLQKHLSTQQSLTLVDPLTLLEDYDEIPDPSTYFLEDMLMQIPGSATQPF